MNQIKLHKTCRACAGTLEEVLSLGALRLNAFPTHLSEVEKTPQIPLILTVCRGCGLAQLDRTVPPDWMFRTYHYQSHINEMMRKELEAVVEEAIALAPLTAGDAVLDIGANDGTLLSHYKRVCTSRCPWRTAIEPALNLQASLQAHADVVFNSYFPDPAVVGSYRIITAIAMCYDLEDPTAFFQAIHDRLAEGGVAVVQFQDLEQQTASAAFDNIVHEHLEYYTIWSLMQICRQAGLTLQRVVTTPINGGSLRVFLRRAEDRIASEQSVANHMLLEAQRGLATPEIREGNLSAFTRFRGRVERAKTQIASVVETALEQGCVIDLLGASTKGNVLLQVLGLGPEQIRRAIDRDPLKTGKLTVTGIPIVGEDQREIEPADLLLTPIWQFRDSILAREAWFLERGGSILFPLPQVEIVRQDWQVR